MLLLDALCVSLALGVSQGWLPGILAQPKGVWAKTSLVGSAQRSSTHWCSCEPSEAGVN